MNKKRCKHGMIKDWCEFCSPKPKDYVPDYDPTNDAETSWDGYHKWMNQANVELDGRISMDPHKYLNDGRRCVDHCPAGMGELRCRQPAMIGDKRCYYHAKVAAGMPRGAQE